MGGGGGLAGKLGFQPTPSFLPCVWLYPARIVSAGGKEASRDLDLKLQNFPGTRQRSAAHARQRHARRAKPGGRGRGRGRGRGAYPGAVPLRAGLGRPPLRHRAAWPGPARLRPALRPSPWARHNGALREAGRAGGRSCGMLEAERSTH